MTDYKQLCEELVEDLALWLESYGPPSRLPQEEDESYQLLKRARTALAEPEPEGPTDDELFDLADAYAEYNPFIGLHNAIGFARAVLARWGNHPGSPDSSTQPIPVSERLPGPKDCDEEGRCWWYGEGGDMVGWTYQDLEGFSYYKATHWLPAKVLPQPS